MNLGRFVQEYPGVAWLVPVLLSIFGSLYSSEIKAFLRTSPRRLSTWLGRSTLLSNREELARLERYHALPSKALTVQLTHDVVALVFALIAGATFCFLGPYILTVVFEWVFHGHPPEQQDYTPSGFILRIFLTTLVLTFAIVSMQGLNYRSFLRRLLTYEKSRDELTARIAQLERSLGIQKNQAEGEADSRAAGANGRDGHV